MAVAVAGEPHKPAGAPLAQIASLDHGGDGRALGLWASALPRRRCLVRGYFFMPSSSFFRRLEIAGGMRMRAKKKGGA